MSDQTAPRVRFAPSPTGSLHVGGARTALFNWLYARGQGGVFILRIEDTDQVRSTEESYAAILESLDWLGLDWDEGPRVGGPCGPYLQSERLDLYREHLQALIASGHAYPSYCTPEEVERISAEAKEKGAMPDYGRDLDADARARLKAEGRPEAWRLRTPDTGSVFWYDLICGKREFSGEVISDRVIFKADGFPTYNFAAVVDDHLMGITHVLRGDDHVSNTPFQLLIYDALGFPRPKFGHMPMILGPDRKRLSKRHGASSVAEFADLGIIPAAMVNYLALLGWSPGGSGDEVMTPQQLQKRFSLKKVNSSPAAFDYDKLNHLNAEHIKRLTPEERLDLARPLVAARGWTYDPAWLVPGATDTEGYLDRLLKTIGGRFSNLRELPPRIHFFFAEDYPVDGDAVAAHLDDAGRARLREALADLERELDPSVPVAADRYDAIVRGTAERLGEKAGAVIHPCRVALTGQGVSAGIFDVMELIGAPRVLSRLRARAGA